MARASSRRSRRERGGDTLATRGPASTGGARDSGGRETAWTISGVRGADGVHRVCISVAHAPCARAPPPTRAPEYGLHCAREFYTHRTSCRIPHGDQRRFAEASWLSVPFGEVSFPLSSSAGGGPRVIRRT